MRDFDFIVSPAKLLTPEIVQMVSSIYEHKGKQELFLEANVDELKTLLEVALIPSTGASNRIEGIFTSDKRSLRHKEVFCFTSVSFQQLQTFMDDPKTNQSTPDSFRRYCRNDFHWQTGFCIRHNLHDLRCCNRDRCCGQLLRTDRRDATS